MTNEMTLVAERLIFPEGPAWDGGRYLYCSNCDADYVTRLDTLTGGIDAPYRANQPEGAFTFEKTNGMTFFEDGSLFACDFGRSAIIRIRPDGRQEMVADSFEGQPLEKPNDLAFAPDGALWFTAPGESGKENPVGPIYRYDLETKQIVRFPVAMAYPNGLAFDAAGAYLYVAESGEDRIVRFALLPDNALGPLEPFCDLSPDRGSAPNGVNAVPDGIAFDAAGFLWVTHYNARTLTVVAPDGGIARSVPLPPAPKPDGPTNIEFAGPNLTDCYITDPGNGALYHLKVETPGLRLFHAPG